MRKQHLSLDALLAQTHWGGAVSVENVKALFASGSLKEVELVCLDRLRKVLPARLEDVTDADLVAILKEWPIVDLRRARRGLWRLFEQTPLLRQLDRVIAARRAGKPKAPPRPRRRVHSVYPDELPRSWQAALDAMKDGGPGMDGPAPVPSMAVTTERKICEFILAARRADAPQSMCIAAAVAYERSLVRRDKPLSRVTIKTSMRHVLGFARYIGAEADVIAHLEDRVRRHENRAHAAIPRKEAKILALPSYAEIFGKAFDLLGEAERIPHAVRAQALRNTAVAIVFFVAFPLRLADTGLRFGRELMWDGTGYRLDLTISKTGRRLGTPILPVFGFFIDQLVLQGSGRQHLAALRDDCIRSERALFVTRADKKANPQYVSQLWGIALGTGCHATRTKLHDEFARLGARGVELAMRACGHRSEKTAEHYRTRAFEMLSLEHFHSEMETTITEEEWREFFE